MIQKFSKGFQIFQSSQWCLVSHLQAGTCKVKRNMLPKSPALHFPHPWRLAPLNPNQWHHVRTGSIMQSRNKSRAEMYFSSSGIHTSSSIFQQRKQQNRVKHTNYCCNSRQLGSSEIPKVFQSHSDPCTSQCRGFFTFIWTLFQSWGTSQKPGSISDNLKITTLKTVLLWIFFDRLHLKLKYKHIRPTTQTCFCRFLNL